jgi:nucleoside-diphosphate-sugar epimerase
MRIFLAGASGVIGVRLIPLLVSEGHVVAGMTRSPEKMASLWKLGAEPVLCDVFDERGLHDAVTDFGPDVVMHQLTILPDVERIPEFLCRSNRIRSQGTLNLLAAKWSAGPSRLVAQSIAWTPPAGGKAVAEHERVVLDAHGVVIRYGAFYGAVAGTYPRNGLIPPSPRIHIDEAARRTVQLLDAPPGVVVVAEDAA